MSNASSANKSPLAASSQERGPQPSQHAKANMTDDNSPEIVSPIPQAAPQRRASDSQPPAPTIDSVRDLLLGDTIKQNRLELATIERQTHNQLGELRVELGDRIDRVVRALSTVNQAVHKEFGAREEAVQASADELSAKMEDRLSFLEAKIYTVVADMERKVSATQSADQDKILAQLAEANDRLDARVAELGARVETQLQTFGSRITTEIERVNQSVAAVKTAADAEAESLGSEVGERLGAIENQLQAELQSLRKDVGKSSVELREEMTAQVAQQQALLSRAQAETRAQLSEHLSGIEGRKVSRADFSTLLHELAARLDQDEQPD